MPAQRAQQFMRRLRNEEVLHVVDRVGDIEHRLPMPFREDESEGRFDPLKSGARRVRFHSV